MFLGLTFILLFVTCCDSIDDGWKGIKPFHTPRKEVERLLGEPKVDDNGYYRYSTPEADIEINYSSTPCSENRYGRGKFKIPVDTVLSYRVIMKTRPKIDDLEFDRQKFQREASGHVLNLASYVNKDNTVSILVTVEIETDEFAREIDYRASSVTMEKLQCKEIN